MNEKSYWLGFSSFSGIGPSKFQLLLKEFGSAKYAFEADSSSLEKVLGNALTPKFIAFRDTFSISKYEERLMKKGVKHFTLQDDEYPKLLAKIKKPPFVLYVKGKFDFNAHENQKTVAIVGTRKITSYGKSVTESLASDLVNSGFVIVSGLALGVDAAAHRATLENKGKTVAVLGCGVDCCSPEENSSLYDRILETGGAVVSEYILGAPPTKGSFPSRNRIISGLSQGVLVTEGAADSGALYTAEDAFSNERPVFAVPGPITSTLSKGPHSLIAKGGKLISSAKEIIQELGLEKSIKNTNSTKSIRGSTKEEQMVIDLLQNEDLHFDEIVKKAKIDSSKLGGILSLMEMKGMIIGQGGGIFSLNY